MTVLNHQDTKTPGQFTPISNNLDSIGKTIVDCAFQVHKTLGPGLTENIYEEAFVYELQDKNINFDQQKIIQIPYKKRILKSTYRMDLIIENKIVVELKCIDELSRVHDAQILAYMKLTNLRLGYLINFNVPVIKQGIKRKVL